MSAVQSISAAFEHVCISAWEHVGGHQLHANLGLLEVHFDKFMNIGTCMNGQLLHALVRSVSMHTHIQTHLKSTV